MKKLISYILLSFCCLISTWAAERQIKGVVLSVDDREPLIGASVYVSTEDLKKAGSGLHSLGVITDLEGHFIINVPSNISTLQCSYVGYESHSIKLIPGKNQYEILLKSSATMLDAVVVTGYQTIERRKLTAAVTKLDITDEKIGTVRSIDQALSGQVAGLSAMASSGTPGAPVKIRIRGTSSLNGTQDPLWVLDGIPLEGTDIPSMEELKDIDNIYQSSIAGLNPADIDNITVLKDAAATAIYGARAANGVIVITTKNGKAGRTKVNFSTKLTYSPNINIDRLNLLNSEEKVNLELDLLRSNYDRRSDKGDVSRIISNYGLLDAYKNGGWDALTPNAQQEILNLKSINTDWNDILFRDVFNQEYNISLSGGSEKATYYTSLGFYDEKGNVSGVESNRLNMVLKTSYQINKMLKVGASIFANQRKNKSYLTGSDGYTNPVYYSRLANPYMRPYDEDGNYIYDVNVQGGKEDSSVDFNIFEERANTSNDRIDRALSSIFDLELRINDQLKFTSQLGYQYDGSSMEKIADHDTYSMRKDKQNSLFAYSDGKRSYLPDGGVHKEYENNSSQITWKAMGEYRNSFKGIHEMEVMAGTEIRKAEYHTLFSAAYGFDRRTLVTKPVLFPNEDQAKLFPLHTKTFSENAYVSGYATGSYSLLQRYTVGGSIRFDGSDVFGVAKKYRYLPLYSVSGLWRVSNEPFMKNLKRIDNFVVRVSYGLQGNIDKNTSPYIIGRYSTTEILPGTSEDKIVLEGAPNRKLRWEKTQSVNVGFDLGLFNNAINLSADYYNRLGKDLIGIQMLPQETGFESTTVNWASMRNQGVEVSLTTRNIHTKKFIWFTNFNLGYNRNKVLQESVAENSTYPGRQGYSVGSIWGLKTAGLDDEGYILFYNKKGEKVSATELFKLNSAGRSTLSAREQRELYTNLGDTEPMFSGGFTNTFDISRFEISINCIFNLNMYVRTTPSYDPITYDRGLNTNRDILNRWTPANTNTIYPALYTSKQRPTEYAFYDAYPSVYKDLDIWIKRADYMRVQSIRVGYKIPENILKKVGISSASVSLEGRNLLVVGADYNNFLDPETMGNPYAQPIPKSVTFGLNLNF